MSQTFEIFTKTNGITPTAVLDVQADSSGVLLPRTDTTTILNPTEGLLIYDTTIHSFRFYNGTTWQTLIPQPTQSLWYADQDGDGYGSPVSVFSAPTAPEFYVGNNLDCDDGDPNINPSVSEMCDGLDNDCDNLVDDNDPDTAPLTAFYIDDDQDGYGDENFPAVFACVAPAGYVDNDFDCNDLISSINPFAPEICNGIDDDCDQMTDEDIMVDDGLACTTDFCDGGQIVHQIDINNCLINGTCYSDGDTNPSNECQECAPNMSQTTWTNKAAGTSCSMGTCLNGDCITQ